MQFDPLSAEADVVLARARLLPGKQVGELTTLRPASDPRRTKGYVGAAVEAFFGLVPNSRREADFAAAGIELKVAAVLKRGGTFSMKERTVVSMIDYRGLISERWETASIRKKLKILFVFFEHRVGVPKSEFVILRSHLWEPEGKVEELIRQDWELVREKVAQGEAHLLAESDGQILGPCTKSRDSRVRVAQPVTHLSPNAKPRAFALKPKFVTALYFQARGTLDAVDSLLEGMQLKTPDSFRQQLLARFDRWIGRKVGEVADELGIGWSAAKNYAARVVRAAFGASEPDSGREFDAAGVTLRMSRISPGGVPYEAMSFPHFDYYELIEEEWVDSDLLSRVEQMLMVPIVGPRRDTPQEECRFGVPVYWRPTEDELEGIRREWEMFRNEIRAGRADRLPAASETRFIHVRPHSRDSRDTLPAPGVGQVIKKSFWLNASFVEELLRRKN